MRNIAILLLMTGTLTLGACSKKPSDHTQPEQAAQVAQGGVDGSGGNLPYFEEESIRDWLQTKHKYYMQDVVHRLFLIKEKSPEDFGGYQAYAEKFLGEDQEALLEEMSKVKYTLEHEGCSSTKAGLHGSDASYYAGTICFSYKAFKNLPVEVMVSKLISMTLHELGHMKGFNERDAMGWQDAFERGPLSKKTITWFNQSYKESLEALKKIDSEIGFAMSAIIGGEEVSTKDYVCKHIAVAASRGTETLVPLSLSTPAYIRDFVDSQIITPLGRMDGDCVETSEVKTAEDLAMIMKSLITANRMIAQFGSPFCKDLMCLDYYPRDSAPSLLRFEALSSFIGKNQQREVVGLENIRCTLKDSNGKTIALKRTTEKTGAHYFEVDEPFYDDLKPSGIYVRRDDDQKSVSVQLMFLKFIPLEFNGFTLNHQGIIGYFFSKGQKEISTKFATYVDNKDPFLGYANYNYSSISSTMSQAPYLNRSYELRCSLGSTVD